MTDRDDREDWRRRHSLLAFGQALAEDDARRRLSAANQPEPSWRDDAVARHRERTCAEGDRDPARGLGGRGGDDPGSDEGGRGAGRGEATRVHEKSSASKV